MSANANLWMFVYVCMCALGLTNDKYVLHMYVCGLHWRAKLTKTERQRDREITIKHRGSYCAFFLWKGSAWKRQDHSLQSCVCVQIKTVSFNFDIVSKSVLGMQ